MGEIKLADAELTEKEMKIAAAKAKVIFVEARGKYQVALGKEEAQKAFLAKKEREWKEQIDAKKKRVAKGRAAVSDAQTSEEGKKSIKFKRRTDVLKFKNPFRIEHARAKVNASIAEGIVGEARQAVLEANKELSAVTAEFKSAQYHHSRWREKLRKRFGYDENDIDGAPKALGVLSAYRGYEPTGATGIAKLSPEDLAEMKPGANMIAKYSDSLTGATGSDATAGTGATGSDATAGTGATGGDATAGTGATGSETGPTELRFKSLENGRTSDSDDADNDGADLEGQEAEEINTARKLSNKGFLLISQYSDAHRSLVDAENNKDQAETEIRTTMKAINVLGSRLQALHEKKRGSSAFKSRVRNGVVPTCKKLHGS